MPHALSTSPAGATGGRFATYQPIYRHHRIATYPLTPERRPAVLGPQNFGLPGSSEMVAKFPDADGLGFWAGARNRLTIIDIDSTDERLVEEMENRYGRSPIRVRTPSGGSHLYFRHGGERRRIRPIPDVDVLGNGAVVAAGTRCPKGEYRIERGSLDDLARLPKMRFDAKLHPPQEQLHTPAWGGAQQPRAERGRNDTLFRILMREARSCDSLDALLAVAQIRNEESMHPPLSADEVVKIATSAWGYEERGKNRFCTIGAWFSGAEVDVLLPDFTDAFVLLGKLRRLNRPERLFHIANEWHAAFGWSLRKFSAARKDLVTLDVIERITAPRKGRAALYRWTGRPATRPRAGNLG